MKKSDAQRLVTLANAQQDLPDIAKALRTDRKRGYDRVAFVMSIQHIHDGVGGEVVEEVEIDLKTAESILTSVKSLIASELERLGYEKD